MKQFAGNVVAFVLVVALSTSASAATVTFTLDMTAGQGAAGTFTLTAAASLGDNGGISRYSIPLTGPILSLDHRSPYAISSANFAPTGFSGLRSADGNPLVSAGQPGVTAPAQNFLYGFGQTPNSFVDLGIPLAGIIDPTSDIAWTAPIVIAKGTFDPMLGRPRFLPPTADLSAGLFAVAGNSSDRLSATVRTEVIDITFNPIVALNALGERDPGGGIIKATAITSIDTPPTMWSNLQAVAGPNFGIPAIAATLDADGNFSWDPTGSKSGPKGIGVLYQWTATATDFVGSDTDVAFSVILVPEPSTLLLVAITSIGCVACLRRSNRFRKSLAFRPYEKLDSVNETEIGLEKYQ